MTLDGFMLFIAGMAVGVLLCAQRPRTHAALVDHTFRFKTLQRRERERTFR